MRARRETLADYEVTPRNRVRRLRENARYDRAAVHGVLDAGLVAHVGFVDDGQPVVIPMIYGRRDETLYLHGAGKARITRLLGAGAPACATVTLLDGIVAARSAFNSSLNYRSAVVFGTARRVDEPSEQLAALERISEHVFPGRWRELRAPLAKELVITGVIALPIESASAKIAAGPPSDDEQDYATRVWAGIVPIETRLGTPIPDDRVLEGVPPSGALEALVGRKL